MTATECRTEMTLRFTIQDHITGATALTAVPSGSTCHGPHVDSSPMLM